MRRKEGGHLKGIIGAISEFIEEFQGEHPTPFASLVGWIPVFYGWAIGCVGFILALWKEGWGGVISLIGYIIALLQFEFYKHDFLMLFFLVSSLLYLVFWWLKRQYKKSIQ